MDRIKDIDELCKPDPFNQAFIVYNLETDESRPLEIKDLHRRVSAIGLKEQVPDDVRRYFNALRNLMLYGWFHHELFTLGGFLAFTAIEMALRMRLGYEAYERSPGMKKLLEEAISKGLISDDEFSVVKQRNEEDEALLAKGWQGPRWPTPSYCSILSESLPNLRNSFMHPAQYTDMGSAYALATLRTAAELINQLFCNEMKNRPAG